MDINNIEKYTILPSTTSMISEMIIIITLFFGYIIYISYLSSYDSGFKPNFVMFIDMIFDRNNDQRFQSYVKNIVNDKKKVETFTSKNESTYFEKIQSYFYQFIAKFYITKNKIYISKRGVI